MYNVYWTNDGSLLCFAQLFRVTKRPNCNRLLFGKTMTVSHINLGSLPTNISKCYIYSYLQNVGQRSIMTFTLDLEHYYPYIEEEQTTQWPKEKGLKNLQNIHTELKIE